MESRTVDRFEGSTLFLTANWLVGLTWMAMVCLDGAARIRYEEQALHAQFGEDFERYQRTTGRVLPRF
ncbi:MAG: hypothetical protein R3335_04055 [Anaerolineales bacterium]|nr:hypothetical protein [Anaerolineales bacterium]